MNFKVTAILLTGGKSSRMGKPKDLLTLNNKTFANIILEKLKKVCDNILIIDSDIYKQAILNETVVADIWPHKGVLGALYSGLLQHNNNLAILCPCDQPLIKTKILEKLKSTLIEKYNNQPLIVNFNLGDKQKTPLLAGYSTQCLKIIEKQIKEDKLKINRLNEKIETWQIEKKEILMLDPKLSSFQNINNLDDYHILLKNI